MQNDSRQAGIDGRAEYRGVVCNSTSGTIGQNAIHNQQRAVVLNNMGLGGNLRSSPFISSFDLDAKAREYVEGSFPRLAAVDHARDIS